MDRPGPRRRRRRSHHVAVDRPGVRRRLRPPRGRDRVAIAQPEPLRVSITEPDRADPNSGSDDRGPEPEPEPDPDADRSTHNGGTERVTDDERTDDAHTDTAGDHAGAVEDPLGPAQLRDDRAEFAHRVAGYRDVADAETLATLDEKLAQR